MRCRHCGYELLPEQNFCAVCGANNGPSVQTAPAGHSVVWIALAGLGMGSVIVCLLLVLIAAVITRPSPVSPIIVSSPSETQTLTLATNILPTPPLVLDRTPISPTNTREPIATPTPTRADTAATWAARATAHARETMVSQATAAAGSIATARAKSTQTASAAAAHVSAWARDAKLVQSIANGMVTTDMPGGQMDALFAHVSVRDLLLYARFVTPFRRSDWDYGIAFRHTGSALEYRLQIDHEKSWRVYLAEGRGTAPLREIASGVYNELGVLPGDTNQLQLAARDGEGYFFINGDFIAALDVSERNIPGDIFISTGFSADHRNPGVSVLFHDFSVYALP